jgi:hypothetical protein
MGVAGAPTWEQVAGPWRARSRIWSTRSALAVALTAVMVLSGLVMVLDAGSAPSPLVPPSPVSDYLRGFGWHLGYGTFVVLLTLMAGCYLALLLVPRLRAGTRTTVVAVVLLQLVVFVGPILGSQDVFSYLAYARMGVLHGIDPYVQGPSAILHDPIYQFVGSSWQHTATAYGPIFTLISYPLALLGLQGAVWASKVLALASSLGALVLVWRCARRRDMDPAQAVLFVGANPVLVVYGLGGAHNDLFMNLLVMVGVTLSLNGRRASSGAALVAAALVKATAALVFPFMLVARRQRAALLGGIAVLIVSLAVGYLAFGVNAVNEVALAGRDSGFVSPNSFAAQVAHLFGLPGLYPVDHVLLNGLVLLGVLYLLFRTHRGYDWISASGWALLLLAVMTTWLLPWYTVWAIPLAAIARDRRLVPAILVVQVLMGGTAAASVGSRSAGDPPAHPCACIRMPHGLH